MEYKFTDFYFGFNDLFMSLVCRRGTFWFAGAAQVEGLRVELGEATTALEALTALHLESAGPELRAELEDLLNCLYLWIY